MWCWESTGVENPAFYFRLGDGSRLVGGCCVGGGVFLSAASARNRSFMLTGVFYVCSAIANPPPRCPLRAFWTGFRFTFPGGFRCVGIQRRPGPGGDAHHVGMSLGGTVGVHCVLRALLGGLHPTKRCVLPGANLHYLRDGLGRHPVVGG